MTTTKDLTAVQVSDEMMSNYLLNTLGPFEKTAAKCLEMAGGDEGVAREAYGRYVDGLLKKHAGEHGESVHKMMRDIYAAVFDVAVAHAAC